MPRSGTPPNRPASPLGTIAIVTDDRLSRERASMLFRVVAILSTFAKVEVIPGGLTEEEVLKQIEVKNCGLVLAPWYHYLKWTRIEAFFGLSRTGGPVFAGYHAEPLAPQEIADASPTIRGVLIDLGPNASKMEILRIVRSLLVEKLRTGIRPLLDAKTTIYVEPWTSSHTLGKVLDSFFAIPEMQNSEWMRRSSSIRLSLMGLWNLVFPDGQTPGLSPSSVRAHFMAGVDRSTLAFRLCYSIPACTPKTALNLLWPKGVREHVDLGTHHARDLLARSCDLIRAHTIAGTQDIEVVAAMFSHAETEPRRAGNVHHLWIEPVAGEAVQELPEQLSDRTRPFPKASTQLEATSAQKTAVEYRDETEAQDAKERFINEAAQKIRKLQQLLEDRESLLRELRAGGIGVAPPLPPPDADALLDALWERVLECEHRLDLFRDELDELDKNKISGDKTDGIRQRIERLHHNLADWEQKLEAILAHLRKSRGSGDQAA